MKRENMQGLTDTHSAVFFPDEWTAAPHSWNRAAGENILNSPKWASGTSTVTSLVSESVPKNWELFNLV